MDGRIGRTVPTARSLFDCCIALPSYTGNRRLGHAR